MRLPLPMIFFAYLAVFLAVIFGSWFLFLWRRHRFEKSARRIFICGVCEEKIEQDRPSWRLRCPHCGASQERSKLKEL
jgi:predicted RNA-binding Zn-ribbon protein involved in translation (DUF1610 family)